MLLRRPCFYCYQPKSSRQSLHIILKHLKDVGFCNIYCRRVNIPDELRHSKRHVIQSSVPSLLVLNIVMPLFCSVLVVAMLLSL
jgi:hypothetical protein